MAQRTVGVRRLRKAQFGKETTAGTATDCDVMWRGEITLADTRVIEAVPEDDGWLLGSDRTMQPAQGAELTIEDTPATYEQVPWILGGGIAWQTTATGDTTTGQYVYTYSAGTSGVGTVGTFSWEVGDNSWIGTFDYGLVTEFHLSGAADEPVQMGATMIGRAITTKGAFYSTSVTVPSVESVYFNKGQAYIDSVGSVGTTLAPGSLVDFNLNVVTGVQALKTADGDIAFGHHKQVGPEWTLDMTLEVDTTSAAERGYWAAETARIVRLQFPGTALAETGSTFSTKMLRIDVPIKYASWDALGDNDGNDVWAISARGVYNTTGGAPVITVVNDNATYT